MTEVADFLFVHAHLFTMEGSGVGYVEDGAVAVRAGRIIDVGPTPALHARFTASEIIDASHHACCLV
jgi:5-methylthioadenosine/S-adenosylhomocysteine deaminase